MITLLKDWKGKLDINDKNYDNVQQAIEAFNGVCGPIHIKLYGARQNGLQAKIDTLEPKLEHQYSVTVKKYMTEKSSPEFDFMAKWNNDNPMPLRTMFGTIEKETRGMVYMKLHGQAEPVIKCMRCGRTLTNPISQHYGIGPECMGKLGFVCDIDDFDTIKRKLVEVTWEGWIIRSAIIEQEKV